jgi:hypothetical protein
MYRTIILPFLYGCETLPLILKEECRLRVFEKRVLSSSKRDEVTGEWQRLHNEKLHDLVLVIRARSQGSGCTAAIRLIVHPVF